MDWTKFTDTLLFAFSFLTLLAGHHGEHLTFEKLPDVDVDVVDLRAQADASMPASNNNVSYTVYSNF